MREQVLVFIGKFFLSDEDLKKRKQKLTTKKLAYYVRATSPGGILPPTVWEKIKIAGFLILTTGISSLIFMLIVFSAVH